MPLPPRLEKETAELRQGFEMEVIEESDIINLVLRSFPFGDGYNRPVADLLLRIPRTYPDSGPDMFWTIPELTLASGSAPQSAESMENYIGKQWRRFSWHKSAWNPAIDNLHGYLEFIRRRLREKK